MVRAERPLNKKSGKSCNNFTIEKLLVVFTNFQQALAASVPCGQISSNS
jgi:DNA-nicking Smr family endonuclease